MIPKNDFLKHYHKARLLERLPDGTGMSINKLHVGASMTRTFACVMIDEMVEEETITVKQVGRISWVTRTNKGRLYLKEIDKFCDVIETLKKDNS